MFAARRQKENGSGRCVEAGRENWLLREGRQEEELLLRGGRSEKNCREAGRKQNCCPEGNCIGPEVVLAVERAGWVHRVSPKKPINLLKVNTLCLAASRGCHDTRK